MNRSRDAMDSLCLYVRLCRINEPASNTSESVGYLGSRDIGEDALESLLAIVDEQSARHSSSKDNTEHLSDCHEANTVRDLGGLDFHLGDCKTSLTEATNASAEDNSIAVDLGV